MVKCYDFSDNSAPLEKKTGVALAHVLRVNESTDDDSSKQSI